jgi:hypothetical protein
MNHKKVRFATLLMFVAIFEATIKLVAWGGTPFEITPLLIAQMILAASFLGRAVSYFTVFEWVRAPFTEVVPHSSGAGEDVCPIKAGEDSKWHDVVREVVGTWMSCPVCAGAWGGLGLVVLYGLWPVFGTYTLLVVSIAGAASILTRVVEMVEWSGRNHREQTGATSHVNKQLAAEMEMADLMNLETLLGLARSSGVEGDTPRVPYWEKYGGKKKDVL